MSVSLAIDPNVRVAGNETYAGFEDVLEGSIGELREGAAVTVREPESGLIGDGTISAVDNIRQLIYVAVDWKSLVFDRRATLCGS